MSNKQERWAWIIKKMLSEEKLFIEDIAEEFGKSPRNCYRDLQALELAGYAWQFDKNQGYIIDKRYSPRNVDIFFTDYEAFAILLCIDALNSPGFPFAGALESGREKLLKVFPEKMRQMVTEKIEVADVQVGEGYEINEMIFNKLQKAAFEKRKIVITYYSQTSSREELIRTVDPYGLICKNGIWYLIAFCNLRQEIRIFRPDRIKTINLLEEQFQIPSGFDFHDIFEHSWDIGQGKPERVRLRFTPEVAVDVKKAKYHKTQQFTDQPDGSVIMEVHVSGLWEITRWILGFGPNVEVLEPQKLRENVIVMVQKTCDLYPEK